MGKNIFFATIFLFMIIAGLVFYQWFTYEKEVQGVVSKQTSNLEIEGTIEHTEGTLSISQNILNIEQDHYYIQLPEHAQGITCQLPNGEQCNINEGTSMQLINIGNISNILFTYSIPIDETKKSIWLKEPLITFFTDDQKQMKANYTVHLSDKRSQSAQWFSGAVSEGVIHKEHLSFFAWTKQSATNFSLYMSKTPLEKVDTFASRISIYTSNMNEVSPILSAFQTWFEQIPPSSGLTVILEDKGPIITDENLVIAPITTARNELEELVLYSYLIRNKGPANQDIMWLWKVLPSFVLDRPVGQEKIYEMSNEIIHMSANAKEDFAKWLFTTTETKEWIDVDDLDAQLSSFIGGATEFFQKNKNEQEPLIPLYFNDPRPIMFHEQKINKNWNAVIRNQFIHFPLVNTMESLGFTVTPLTESQLYLLSKGGNNWRLYTNKNYYIYNQDNYGLTNRPLQMLGEDVYISEQWLELIFHIEVIKRDEAIYLR